MPYPKLITGGGAFTYADRDAINALISGQGILSPGDVYWVRPINGSDTNDGSSPASALQTLGAALAASTPNQNDTLLLCAENNGVSTTARQNALLDWNKDGVHLVGVNAGSLLSQRSRIAFTANYAAATDLFKLSANGCLVSGIEFFMGVASVLPTGCMTTTGVRNVVRRCHIAGFGAATNDISGAYSLQLKGAEENLFEDCTIGVDTIQLGAGTSNSQILLSNNAGVGCTRNHFRGCRVLLYTNSATAAQFLRAGATAQDRWNLMEDCLFLNPLGTSLTQAMTVAAGTSPSGVLILTGPKTGLVGAGKWNATDGVIWSSGGPLPTNTSWGKGVLLTS
jgi:hypothetical protein